MTHAPMHIKERSEAIQRAQRALKALGEHPRSSKKELGHARECLNSAPTSGGGVCVWKVMAQAEAMAVRRYGVLGAENHCQLGSARGQSSSRCKAPRSALSGVATLDRHVPAVQARPTDLANRGNSPGKPT